MENKQEALSLMAELVKLANADLEIRDAEFEFLKAIGEQLGLSKSEFEMVFDTYIEFTPPKPEFDRILQFHRLVLLMNIDMENDEREEHMVIDLGIKMGLPEGAIRTILNEMHQFPNKIIPPDQLIKIFKTFNN